MDGQASTSNIFAWLDMSPPKDGKGALNPEALIPSTSDFKSQMRSSKCEQLDVEKLTVKPKFADSKTDHTSANGSQSSVKSSPDMKAKSNKIEMLKASQAAMKLNFDEEDNGTDDKMGLPLYRKLGNRQVKSVYKPKTICETMTEEEWQNVLEEQVFVSDAQEAKWTNYIDRMIV